MKKVILLIMSAYILWTCSMQVVSAEPMDTYISDTAIQACYQYGEEYSICPELLMAIIEAESRGKPDVRSGSCKGLMQVSEKWHKERMKKLGCDDLYDEEQNIHVGADLLFELFEEYEDVGIVLMMYHGEQDALSKDHLSGYAKRILARSEELERLHGKW